MIGTDRPLLDLLSAQVARDEAVALGDLHAAELFRVAAFAAVDRVARARARFIVDDVWAAMGAAAPSTHDKRAMGAVMQRACKVRLIAPTADFQPSAQRQCHANPRRVWRSLVCR
jgi:hypothetical protein